MGREVIIAGLIFLAGFVAAEVLNVALFVIVVWRLSRGSKE